MLLSFVDKKFVKIFISFHNPWINTYASISIQFLTRHSRPVYGNHIKKACQLSIYSSPTISHNKVNNDFFLYNLIDKSVFSYSQSIQIISQSLHFLNIQMWMKRIKRQHICFLIKAALYIWMNRQKSIYTFM